jgi:hypothetical protein
MEGLLLGCGREDCVWGKSRTSARARDWGLGLGIRGSRLGIADCRRTIAKCGELIPDGSPGRKCSAHPREDVSLRPLSRVTNVLFKLGNWALAVAMLEMKEPPGMCMKTKVMRQNVMLKSRGFARKCTHCAIINKNLLDLLAESHELRDKSRKLAPTFRSARAELNFGSTKYRGFPRCTRNKGGYRLT